MKAINKPLFALTANDLMSETLVIVPQEMSLQGAAHLLMQARVTGAPVVDRDGKCIGVLSSMDFVHLVQKNRHKKPRCSCEQAGGVFTSSQIVESEGERPQLVGEFMTENPVIISPSINIGELAQMMVDAHIHRVIVCDKNCKPIGLVSTTDILAAVAGAFQAQPRESGESRSTDNQEVVDNLVYSLE